MKTCDACGKYMTDYGCGLWICNSCGSKVKEAITCQKCGEREATQIWCDSGVFGWAHGMGQNWCEICVLETQLEHAKERAAAIPEMEKKLEELKRAT